MSAIKGYLSKIATKFKNFEYATIEPVGNGQYGLNVSAQVFLESVVSDAAEAGTTSQVIVATAHVAKVGDLIRFTSGAADGLQSKVQEIDTNSITLIDSLTATPSAADTFDILRPRFPTVDQLGNTITSSLTQFTLDGSTVTVTEDTVTPANNIPLPVKLTSVTGDINITANDLNVQTSHSAVNFDSMRVGDGTDLLDVVVEDSASAGGESGILAMAVRNSAGVAMTDADGDYGSLTVDDTGRLRVDATITEAATAADGGALPALTKVISGYDGANVQVILTDTNGVLQEQATAADGAGALPTVTKVISGWDGANVQAVSTDANGRINVNVVDPLPAGTNNIGDVDVLTEPATVADGGALPAVVKVIGGYDGANVQAIATDASGNLQVDVLASAGQYAEDSAHVSGDLLTPSGAVRNDAGTSLVDTDGDYSPLSVDSNGNLRSVLAASTNNIGDVDVLTEPATSADAAAGLPAVSKVIAGYDGTNIRTIHTDTSGDIQTDVLSLPGSLTGYAEDSAHNSGDIGLMPLAVRNDAGTALAADGDYIPFTTDSGGNLRTAISGGVSIGGNSVVTTVRNDYTSTSVTTGAWVELVASLGSDVEAIEIFDSSGETLELGTGAAAAETRLILVFPGGNGRVPISVASGTRLSIRAVSATASVGELDLNIYGA